MTVIQVKGDLSECGDVEQGHEYVHDVKAHICMCDSPCA